MNTIILCGSLLGFATFFQSLECLKIRSTWTERGIWRWSILRRDLDRLPHVIRFLFDTVLKEKGFTLLLAGRLFASISLFFHPFLFNMGSHAYSISAGIIFISSWLISIRWRGSLNGGSDSMTAIVALSVWIASLFPNYPIVTQGCLAFLAVQLTASYWIAGLVKLKNPVWRNGKALPQFFNVPGYNSPPEWVHLLFRKPGIAKVSCVGVILFECLFPLAWLSPTICAVFLISAFAFHLMNFWIFGLNRFVFAWLAAYPALYFWSQR
jgi:hypothetical protein